MKKVNTKKKVSTKKMSVKRPTKKHASRKVISQKSKDRALKKIIRTMEKKVAADIAPTKEIDNIFLRLASDKKVTRKELGLVKKHVNRLISSIKDRPVAPTPLPSAFGPAADFDMTLPVTTEIGTLINTKPSEAIPPESLRQKTSLDSQIELVESAMKEKISKLESKKR